MKIDLSKSEGWLKEALNVIPGGSSTLAKKPNQFYSGHCPYACEEASAGTFIDVDGNTWIDCEMAMGSVVWGHAKAEINDAIIAQIKRGSNYSLPSTLETDLGKMILERLEHYERVRFSKNGADAVSGAVRIARLFTGKQKVISSAYHGWHDWCAYGYYGIANDIGVPKNTKESSIWLTDGSINQMLTSIKENFEQIAAVVLVPDLWLKSELESISNACRESKIVLIFDEVSTGMRNGLKGVTGKMGIWPDLLCISKGLANGLPLAALIGTSDLMSLCDSVKLSNAHNGECLALAAAIASESMIKEAGQWPTWEKEGNELLSSIRKKITESGYDDTMQVTGNAGGFRVHTTGASIGEDLFRVHFVKSLASFGIYSKGYILLCDEHTKEQFDHIRKAIEHAIDTWN